MFSNCDVLSVYDEWPTPDLIISDGAYGLGLFPGEPKDNSGLVEWYAPHFQAWTRHSRPGTTLWFWNREIGWSVIHPSLEKMGWQYEEIVVWNKGISHLAGNVNSKTIHRLPVVTEIAVRYTRKPFFPSLQPDIHKSEKDWLRYEWKRSGLPIIQANQACGVKNAATRKYLTQCSMWYRPSGSALLAMSEWCEAHGLPNRGIPYFSLDGKTRPDPKAWDDMRPTWNHIHGLTNVWSAPSVRNTERLKDENGHILHANQKPLSFMRHIISLSSNPGDVVWEPFGGLFSASLAAIEMGRRAFGAEKEEGFFRAGMKRLASAVCPAPTNL